MESATAGSEGGGGGTDQTYVDGWHELVLDEANRANVFGFITGERSGGWQAYADSDGSLVAAMLGWDD